MTALVIQGDARHLPLPDASVDLICTSPPYFALRSYTDEGGHYPGQIGSEATPAEWLEAMWECTAEMMRVLKPEGSLWVNLGDKYASQGGTDKWIGDADAEAKRRGVGKKALREDAGFRRNGGWGIPNKSLLGIPWRYAIGCIDQLGLILRAEVIWSKPNPLPESVTDRVRRSHEQWFHFTLQPRYYAAVDEIREAHTGHNGADQRPNKDSHSGGHRSLRRAPELFNALGKLPGSVWNIPSEPLQVPKELGIDHFAAFPTEWPRRLILGWSPPGICTQCGQGRRPVATVDYIRRQWDRSGARAERNPDNNRNDGGQPFGSSALRQTTITGYACACPESTAPTRPSIIVDPFGGTGTTALVAHALGRIGISVDMSGDYSRLARWRTTDRGELARALRVEKPKPVPVGQMDMFEGAL